MIAKPRVLVLLCGLLLFSGRVGAAGFTDDQHALLDHIVESVLADDRQKMDQFDTMLENVASAYSGSVYGKDPGSLQILKQLREQATTLKAEITKVGALVLAHRVEDANPAVMLLLLSREQTLGFHLYKWIRTTAELTDLANASSKHNDPLIAKFTTEMIETAEAGQETLSTAIQGITGVLGHDKP